MVDVAAAAAHAPVVQQGGGAVGGAALEASGLAATVPGALVLRLVTEGEDDAPEVRVLATDPRLAVGLAAVVFAAGARSSDPAV